MSVYITSKAHHDLWAYIRSVKTEIGGWGYAKWEGEHLVWYETFLVPQVVSAAEVDFDTTNGDAVAIEKAAEDGVLGAEGHVWVSWHSHHTMKAYWSGTDDTRIEELAKAGIQTLLSFVGNHDHDYQLRLDMFGVKHGPVTVPQVTLDKQPLFLDPQDAYWAEISDAVAKNVTERKWGSGKGVVVKGKSSAPAVKDVPVTRAEIANQSGCTVAEAFEVKELMDEGLSYDDARELVLDTKPDEFMIGYDYDASLDQLAWRDDG